MDEVLKTKQIGDTLSIYNITPENQHLLIVSDDIKYLYIFGYFLDHYEIPKGIKFIEIKYIGLKSLIIPEGVETVDCCRNFLRELDIPKSLINLKANKNLLSKLNFRSKTDNKLQYLDIRSNLFTRLDFYNQVDNLGSIIHFNASMNAIQVLAPEIRNLLYMQQFPCPESDPSSDDEDSELNILKNNNW
jgi:hypothetical protein